MKREARESLKNLGSTAIENLGWRDMWTMVAKKGDRLYGELYSKSNEPSSWGASVQLRVEVSLVPINEGTK